MTAIPWRILFAEALIRTERFDDAEAAVSDIEDLAEANPSPLTTIHALRLRGVLEDARGRGDSAERALSEGHLIAGRSQLPFASAQLELAYGRLLRRAGKRRRAIAQLQSARQRFVRMGARPYIERCDEELAGCGLHSDDGSATGPISLTPREWSVAHLVASGLSNPETAAKLYVSTKTVEYHLGNVFSKLNITSRRELETALAAAS
jgi:ATP/maltotriose-dependent transcriptional regulator MalT